MFMVLEFVILPTIYVVQAAVCAPVILLGYSYSWDFFCPINTDKGVDS